MREVVQLFVASKREISKFVNLAAVADVVEINSAKFHIKFVKHTVVADAQLEFRAALQSLVRESFQPRAHVVNLALHHFADAGRQIVEGF
jgi:hypothetical protein